MRCVSHAARAFMQISADNTHIWMDKSWITPRSPASTPEILGRSSRSPFHHLQCLLTPLRRPARSEHAQRKMTLPITRNFGLMTGI